MEVDGPGTEHADRLWRLCLDTHAKPDIGATMIKSARITGRVEYREGDGANITIRPGACKIEETALDATISWTDGDTHGSAAMPLSDYRRYIASTVIQLDGVRAS
jgi:hypothetical protein